MVMGESNPANQGGSTSGQQAANTSEQTKTFTEEQLNAAVNKAQSDALAEVGRLKKVADDATKTARSTLERITQMQLNNLQVEEDAAKDDPAKLADIRRRRNELTVQSQVDDERRKAEEAVSAAQAELTGALTLIAEALSIKYNVGADILVQYGGRTKDSMETLAKTYGERTQAGQQAGIRMTGSTDSGKTVGSGGQTIEQLIEAAKNPQLTYKERLELQAQLKAAAKAAT